MNIISKGRGAIQNIDIANGYHTAASGDLGEQFKSSAINFSSDRVVPTGRENSPRTLSTCFWRRYA
jgi:hypothetical protein